MNGIIETNKCCGCEACLDVCPQQAISMQKDKYGFRRPKIDLERCINCRMCVPVCPVKNEPEDDSKRQFHYFAGYRKDLSRLMQSTSGGAASAISEAFIDNGGVVFGVKYSASFTSAYYDVAESESALDAFKNSKYIQSEKRGVYKKVSARLKDGQKVLFIGLPCEVAAMKRYAKNHENLFTVALVCHGPTSPSVAEEYCAHKSSQYKAEIVDLNVRSKQKGWETPTLSIAFSNGKSYSEDFYSTEYGLAFSLLLRECCYRCAFKGDHINADIVLGDCWGITKDDAIYNEAGVSQIVVLTDKGDFLLKSATDFKCVPIVAEKVSKSLLHAATPQKSQHKDYQRLFALFGCVGAFKIMKSLPYRLKHRLFNKNK